ncbi:MAG: hypothetical protein LBN39_05610 [Planctomycetaceae bacterium]|jgi:hypothetical protein|nr:hypothetical protein [Planctomycetaceae bacterium]
MFDSPTHSFPGYLDEQGGYAVGESEDGAGVPPGDYTVWLAGTAIVKEAVPKKKQKTPKTAIDENGVEEQLEYPDTFEIPQVSQQYTLPDTSPLKFAVKSDGPKTFDIVVERYSNKKR